jgi:hypothetical protein
VERVVTRNGSSRYTKRLRVVSALVVLAVVVLGLVAWWALHDAKRDAEVQDCIERVKRELPASLPPDVYQKLLDACRD